MDSVPVDKATAFYKAEPLKAAEIVAKPDGETYRKDFAARLTSAGLAGKSAKSASFVTMYFGFRALGNTLMFDFVNGALAE